MQYGCTAWEGTPEAVILSFRPVPKAICKAYSALSGLDRLLRCDANTCTKVDKTCIFRVSKVTSHAQAQACVLCDSEAYLPSQELATSDGPI